MDANTIIENYLTETGYEDLKGYEGFYKINKKGELWSCHYKASIFPEQKEGYLSCHLSKNKERHRVYIHRLLAIQYIPNPDNLPEVDHIDRNRANNNLDNLRWVDKSIQNNNKSNCISLKTEEEQQKRIEDIKEYKRLWAEKDRRAKGIQPKKEGFDAKKYARDWARAKRASLTDEEREAINAKKREARKAKKEQNK